MKKIFLALFLICCASTSYGASESENISNQQSQAIQTQQQIEHGKELQIELNQVAQEQEKKEKEAEEDLEEKELSENDGKIVQNLRPIQCFRPREITFSENKLLTAAEEKSLTEKYLNRCFNLAWLQKFDREVTQFLASKGYATSTAKSDPQSFVIGKMRVQIVEGVLEKIVINEDGFADRAQLLTIFGFDDLPKGGKVLNMYEIEPVLARFRRLNSNKVTVKIIAGSASSKSIIVIENHPQNTARLKLSYDNIGSKNTGARRETISFSKDNLLNFNDVFTLSRTANDLDPRNDRRSNGAISGSWAVPFEDHLLTLSSAKSSYFFLTGSSGTIRASGFTATKAANFESLLFRDKRYKLSSNVGFTSRDNQIFTDEVRNESQSRKSSITTLAMSNTFFLDSATLFLKPSYIKSLNILNSKKDGAETSRFTPHTDLEIVKFYANYVKKFTVPKSEIHASYNLSFDSQWSKNHLYTIDQFSSGGFYSVRGFRSGNIVGDSGFNIRNEITTNLGKLILSQISSEKIPENLAALNYFSLTPFYDYGQVRQRGFCKSGRLNSAGIIFSYSKNDVRASLTFAHTIFGSAMLSQNYSDENTVYFDIGTEFSFL